LILTPQQLLTASLPSAAAAGAPAGLLTKSVPPYGTAVKIPNGVVGWRLIPAKFNNQDLGEILGLGILLPLTAANAAPGRYPANVTFDGARPVQVDGPGWRTDGLQGSKTIAIVTDAFLEAAARLGSAGLGAAQPLNVLWLVDWCTSLADLSTGLMTTKDVTFGGLVPAAVNLAAGVAQVLCVPTHSKVNVTVQNLDKNPITLGVYPLAAYGTGAGTNGLPTPLLQLASGASANYDRLCPGSELWGLSAAGQTGANTIVQEIGLED
jgi:hypothetical protein